MQQASVVTYSIEAMNTPSHIGLHKIYMASMPYTTIVTAKLPNYCILCFIRSCCCQVLIMQVTHIKELIDFFSVYRLASSDQHQLTL